MRAAGLAVGVVFGVVLSWTGLSSPDVIREGLLFQDAYLFLFFGSAVVVATAGQWLARRAGVRAPLTGERVDWRADPPQRRHITGSVLFGIGWAVACACPGPILTQVGQGIPWGLATLAGTFAGTALYLRGRSPASRRSPASSPSAATSGP
jgi:uncharacterized membrane protein YedE/YeeE